jgi:hypothetical protein
MEKKKKKKQTVPDNGKKLETHLYLREPEVSRPLTVAFLVLEEGERGMRRHKPEKYRAQG